MKKIFLLLILLAAFTVKSFAQYNLIVFAEQGEKFWLIINGVKQNTDPQTNVKVTDLPANSYKMKVIFEDNNLPDMDKNLFFNDLGEYTFNIKKNNKGEYVLRPVSMVPIPATAVVVPNQYVIVYGAPAPTTTTVVTAPGTVTNQTTTTTTTGNPDNVNLNVGVNVGGTGVGINMNVNDGIGSSTTQQTTTTTTTYSTVTTTSGDIIRHEQPTAPVVVYVPGYGGPVGCPVPMAPADFSAAKNSIALKSFESTKLEMAKQITNSNCFVTEQVKEIMQLFDFEASKLDFAKYAYGHTYDKGNYFKVNDAFEFESSVSELNDYINGK